MGTTKAFLTGTLLGAGAMYFFDSRMGRRRRVMLEDQLRRLSRQTACGVDAGLRDLGHRAEGVLHDVGSMFTASGQANEQRQRSQAGRVRQFKWTPGPRLVAASAGTALMANCVACRTPGAFLLGALGAGLFARAMGDPRGGISIERTIEIEAPVDRVYAFFANPENYLRISDVVTNVEVFGDGRFAKDISLVGIPVHFEERFTCMDEDRALETHSEPGSAVEYCKALRFEKQGDNRTRLHLHFTYQPPGGVFGHAAATLLGIDPKSELTDLLMRAKYFLETGREPHDAVARRRRMAGGGNGRQKAKAHPIVPHGSGAPTDDNFSMAGAATYGPPWPPARPTTPETVDPLGQFPLS